MREATSIWGRKDMVLVDSDWVRFDRDGFLHLGRVVGPDRVEALKQRVDDLAAGRVDNPRIEFQPDTGGDYEALPEAVSRLRPGTVLYRKVQGLEHDELFGELVKHPLFIEVCARMYGPHAPVSLFRAMVMNKPAGQGTELPWHQDGGSVWKLDRDPLVTIWVALDDATPDNGCMDVVPGSHRRGLLTWSGSTVSDDDAAKYCGPESRQPLPVAAGHAVLIHNWLLHRSGSNPTDGPRRAFTCCLMDGRTRNNLTGTLFPLVWGEEHDEAAYLRQLLTDNDYLTGSHGRAEEYALSLKADNQLLHESLAEATAYARSLEQAIEVGRAASPVVATKAARPAVRALTGAAVGAVAATAVRRAAIRLRRAR